MLSVIFPVFVSRYVENCPCNVLDGHDSFFNLFVCFSLKIFQVVKVANVSLLALYKEKKERPRS